MPIEMSRSQMDELIAHAREGFPHEVCGLLAGQGQKVLRVLRMTNTEPSPVSYHMDSGEQFRSQRWMREQGFRMVGIYHSHPITAPVPSDTDIRLAAYPDAVYVIVGLGSGGSEVRAYRIEDGRVEPEEMIVVEEAG